METLERVQRIAFGVFEVDLHTGELRKGGFRVRLAGQPFKVLLALLEKPGEVVTREELLTQVWGTNTNVDFEQAISGAVKKIREALGDSADNPRFIETLPKRGYRFIAPVTTAVQQHEPAPRPDFTSAEHLISPQPLASPEALAANPSQDASGLDRHSFGLPPASELVPPRPAETASHPHTAVVPWASFKLWGWTRRELVLGLVVIGLLGALAAQWHGRGQPEPAPYRITQITHHVPLSLGPPNVESLLTLAHDGDRILTSVLVDGRSRLSAIYPGTSDVQQITLPAEIASGNLADMTRDGSKLLVRSNLSTESEQPLWIVPSAGGSAQRVSSVLAHDATWMPDGTGILYANENELDVIRQEDGISLPYAKLQGRAFWLRWSPDGKLLRFTLMNPVTHTTSLWELDSQNHRPQPISAIGATLSSVCCGVWTADGNGYVFQANENLWQLTGSGRGSKLTQLTNGPLRCMSPGASRTGSRIFFVGLESPSGLQQLDSQRQTFQAAPPFLAEANRVEYSRDGVWVAWTDIYEKLWRARAVTGSDKVQLTSDGTEVFLAHWSLDGKRLAIMAREHGGLWQTYLVDAAGGRPEALLKETRNSADPGWGPDGRTLVYGREPDLMGKETGPRDLRTIDLVTHRTEVIPDSEGLFSPRWSPDGHWIVALSLDQKTVMLYDVKARQWKQLASTSAADPVWSSDSKSIYLHAFQADREPILKISVPDGGIHTVASLDNFQGKEAANYFFGGLTPTNTPLVQPGIGTGNLYSLELPSKSSQQ